MPVAPFCNPEEGFSSWYESCNSLNGIWAGFYHVVYFSTSPFLYSSPSPPIKYCCCFLAEHVNKLLPALSHRMPALQLWISLLALIAGTTATVKEGKTESKFSDILSVIDEKRESLSQHRLFEFMRDEALPWEKRLSFAPYLLYLTMTFADVCDTLLYVPNPTTELERRINTFISDDDFHYNFYLNDITALGYTLDRFGSLPGVLRHIWGDESRAIRQLMYTWISIVKKYDDPLITFVTIESLEAAGKDFFETAYKIRNPDDSQELQYFGTNHAELEGNHSQTAWTREEDISIDNRPLGKFDVLPVQLAQAMEIVDDIFERYIMLELFVRSTL